VCRKPKLKFTLNLTAGVKPKGKEVSQKS